MKKITLTLIAISLFIVKSTKAQEEELIASEPISSGCLSQTRGAEESALPTIKLTKEGSILSVELLNYRSNCGTTGFEVEKRMIGGNNDTPSVVISVVPVIPAPMDCICPFNISYTVRGLEKNKFYLTCWWFDGQVELTEGEPLVLEYKTEDVVIDGLKYRLLKTSHQAKLLYQIPWNNEAEIIQIPSEVEYEGENYTVTTIVEELFGSNNTIKKIIIPKTIKNTEFGSLEEIPSNPFSSCLSLETIEVEEGSPVFSSVDGVLFSTDKKTLIGYPAGSPRESYTVPDGVKTAKIAAFFNSQHLKKIVLTNDMETLGLSVFGYGKNLEEVILSSNIKELPSYIFRNCKKLNSVFIPKGVTTIASSAFEGCISLESISLPESVATIGTAAFMGCTSLESATLSPNLKVIPTAMFRDCSKLAEVIIPFGITTIGNGAFAGCKAMRSFDLPESINYIDDYAFRYLSDLKDIYCHARTAPNTSKNAFWNVDLPQVTLHVPASSVDSYQSTSPWNQFGAILPLETDIATWEVQTGEVTSIQAGSPVDVTKESSSIQLVYRNIPVMKFDNITSISFKGYNPGKEQVRHLKVWLASGESGRYSEEVCVFDDNCSIPKGGTAEECIPLLRLNFNSPYEYHSAERFYVRIECTGEAEEELLFFECQNDDQPVATFDVSAEVKYFSGTLADQDGNPIGGARVSLYHYNYETETTEVEYTAESDADGHYSVRVEQSNISYLLTVSAPGFPRYQVDYIFYLNANSYSYPSPPSDITLFNKLDFKAGQQATIILPVAPDPSWGRYYRLDRRENIYDIIFEREYEPQANVPYVIFPERDFSIDLNSYDLENLPEPGFVPFPDNDMYRPLGLHGTYESCYAYKETVPSWFASLLDDTPDCIPETSNSFARVGAFRAYLLAADATQINCIFKGENDDTNLAYRPMIEDDKVWKVGAIVSGNPVQWVQYYYLDGDTIIDGKTCKQMMRQRFVSPDYAAANEISQENSLKYVGAWYEENKKVYFYSATNKQMKMLYDFSLEDNGTFQMDGLTYVVGPRQTGGIEGFKGVYRDIKQVDGESIYRCAPWLEGVGVIYGSPRGNVFNVELAEPMWNLMACYVGDEVIYLNDALEDGATPEGAEARNRFDFTHTIKNQPKAPMRGEAEASIYGEYSELQLSIHLDPLDDAYLVRITDESGKAVYEKNINAGTIVGLNIDISGYAKGRYTVTVENSRESFTGVFEAQMTGIDLTPTLSKGEGVIYNLQGQRIRSLQKGLNIVNGRKVYVK